MKHEKNLVDSVRITLLFIQNEFPGQKQYFIGSEECKALWQYTYDNVNIEISNKKN